MSAAKHPYDIRDERGHFVRVSPEVRSALEAMRQVPPAPSGGVVHLGTFQPPAQSKFDPEPTPYCDEIYRPAKINWLERLIRRWMWRR